MYEYRGGGNWTAVLGDDGLPDPLARADDLDSENDPDEGYYVKAGPMKHGDYFGPWIWSNLRDVLNLMVWTIPSEACVMNYIPPSLTGTPQLFLPAPWSSSVGGGDPNTIGNAVNDKGASGTGADAAGAKSAAESAFAAATTSTSGSGDPTNPAAPHIESTLSGSGGSYFGSLDAQNCYIGCRAIYQGRKRVIDTYLYAHAPGGAGTFLANGTGLAEDVWKKWPAGTGTFAAGSDYFGPQTLGSPAFGYALLPAWGPADGNTYGLIVKGIILICRWDQGGFTYTRGTPY